MEEAIGIAIGVIGIGIAFKGAIDTILFFESFFDQENFDCSTLAAKHHVQATRLWAWGQQVLPHDPDKSALLDKPEQIQDTIKVILIEIQKLNKKVEGSIVKYNVRVVEEPEQYSWPESFRHLTIRPKSRFRWIIKGKKEFETFATELKGWIDNLYRMSSFQPAEKQLLHDTLPSLALSPIHEAGQLRTLGNPALGENVARSARAKLEYQASPVAGRSLRIEKEHLKLSRGSNLGFLSDSAGNFSIPIWIEWKKFGIETSPEQHLERIGALGALLVSVIDPALRLPPCHGIYDDEDFEEQYRDKRVGFVFGLPPAETRSRRDEDVDVRGPDALGETTAARVVLRNASEAFVPTGPLDGPSSDDSIRMCSDTTARTSPYPSVSFHPGYDPDFRANPPRTLGSLIRDGEVRIPSLGDRFRLAYTLAVAFSRFHTFGWLHKGVTADSIVFFTRVGGGLSVTEPFVTGFQYSRPQGDASLSESPLQDKQYEYYYHPEVDQHGFSRKRDLYGLGVVLCEIGRWTLIPDTARGKKKEGLTNRTAWKTHMFKVGKDLGWRMGELYQGVVLTLLECDLPDDGADMDAAEFARQFVEKVIRSLSKCQA